MVLVVIVAVVIAVVILIVVAVFVIIVAAVVASSVVRCLQSGTAASNCASRHQIATSALWDAIVCKMHLGKRRCQGSIRNKFCNQDASNSTIPQTTTRSEGASDRTGDEQTLLLSPRRSTAPELMP